MALKRLGNSDSNDNDDKIRKAFGSKEGYDRAVNFLKKHGVEEEEIASADNLDTVARIAGLMQDSMRKFAAFAENPSEENRREFANSILAIGALDDTDLFSFIGSSIATMYLLNIKLDGLEPPEGFEDLLNW